MTTQELSQSIKRVFTEENHRLVFWYDTDREFGDRLDDLNLVDVTLVRLDQTAALELKILLEMTDTTSSMRCMRNRSPRTTGCSISASTIGLSMPTRHPSY